ncbi:hypothetical protein CORC01_10517 [Colletotrichum orchidophilum]|uniref:DUF7730 domain-containing protein n=1 Tax=Colletotrichum orchidophilum TaxID=1209926 RepID=A0A1G4AYD5_9PEZI|nr:uncharacterized protein CORC01_10517 [Colletotrichum orchidophilum]OHE94179.1 hypothetical protein CORC01_10517 [Colletotrichum orchidophilum]
MSELPIKVPSLGRDSSPRVVPRDTPLTAPDADAAPATAIKGDDRAEAHPHADADAGSQIPLAIRTRPPSREVKKRATGFAGPFFEVLSSDLRYQIYQLAFGRKILHLYLLYRRSLQPDVRWRKGHQPVPAWYPHSPSVSPMDPPFADASMTPQWYWWSCVCGPEDRKLETKLSDQCPRGFYQTCGPRETYLGILPWLLTCRRAYEETIKVLYASNTFKFEQRLEAMYFPYAIATPQLKWITSLEIRIPDRDESLIDKSLDKAPRPSHGAPLITELRALSPRDQYLSIINSIAPTFPALRRLHISFEGSVRRVPVPRPNVTTLLISTLGEVDTDELESLILGPIDAMPADVEKQVLFYQSLYTALLTVESQKSESEVDEVESLRSDGRPGWTKFWRSVESAEGGKAGYWVCKHG